MKEPKGKAKGGAARAMALTPEQRREIAMNAGKARWKAAEAPKATHTGDLHIGDIVIPCAVLPDGTRVLSQRGVGRALGRAYGSVKDVDDGGGRLPFFLAAKALFPFVDNELLVVLQSPIEYRHSQGGGVAHGIPASALPKICEVWLKAKDAGTLNRVQMGVAARAEILMRGLAHVGIVALVDEATGFQKDRARDALAQILEAFVAKELQPYVKTFPADYYEQLFRLYNLPYPPTGNKSWRPSFFGNVTNEVVYARLAPELLPELKKAASKAEKKAKLHQWLTQEVGHPKLKEHLASIVTIMKLSVSPRDFMAKVSQIHPRYGETKQLPLDEEDAT